MKRFQPARFIRPGSAGRGEVIQLDLTAFGFGGGGRLAIDAHGGEVRIKAADDDITAFALVVGGGHTRHAADGFADILIRQLARS